MKLTQRRQHLLLLFLLVFTVLVSTNTVFAQEASSHPPLPIVWWLIPIGSIVALLFAYIFYKTSTKTSEGTDRMIEIAQAVREGASAYLARQYKTVVIVFVGLCFVLIIMAFVLNVQNRVVPFAFLTAGTFSGLCGYLGMKTATNTSARVANAARESLSSGLRIGFRAGAVMGLIVVGFILLDYSVWFLILYYLFPKIFPGFFGPSPLTQLTIIMLSFAMGASTQALFARVGGGIYTKAADVGADLVGKVEAGIPEDDPRNPATIADNVGDNVGDVAGMGADLYESFFASILSAAALGAAAAAARGSDLSEQLSYLVVPPILAGVGAILSVIGVYIVRTKEGASMRQLVRSVHNGINISSIGIAIISAIVLYILNLPWQIWGAIIAGLAGGIIIGKSTDIYTSDEYNSTRNVAEQATTGAGTVIIGGLSVGMMSTAIPVITIVIAVLISYFLPGGANNPLMGLYGVGLAAVGMLSTLGVTLATDAYGPIADNAGGNAEMSDLPDDVRERTDLLDAFGNTTAATGKGFAIGSAALTGLTLLAGYLEAVRSGLIGFAFKEEIIVNGNPVKTAEMTISQFMDYFNVTLMNPYVLAGLFIGAVTVFFFCSLTMRAVGDAASDIVKEVRRQFKERDIMEGNERPDYQRCVDISTIGAQKRMILPALLAIIVPLVVGLLFGVAGVIGLLAGALTTGFVMAVMMANAGAAWDNAKKYIEKGNLGGKGSDAHKAAVVGDTVGDPFKDTSGPSLNILIKLMSVFSVVFAGFIVKYGDILSKLFGIGN